MKPHYFFASVTRCSDLWTVPFESRPLDREHWATGDFVVGRVVGERNRLYRCETKSGRMTDMVRGDLLVGAPWAGADRPFTGLDLPQPGQEHQGRLAIALLILNGRADWVGDRFRNRPVTVVVLVATLAFFAWVGWRSLMPG